MKSAVKKTIRSCRKLCVYLLANLLFVVLPVGAGHPLDELVNRYPFPTTQHLNAAAYGNGTWVIAGNSGQVLVSTDLATWQTRSVGVVANLRAIEYINNMFIAVGGGRVLTSNDGVDWTEPAGGAIGLSNDGGIAYGDGVYMVVGNSGAMGTSPDLVTWTPVNTGHTSNFYGITFANGRFVAVGNGGTITQGAAGENVVTTTEGSNRLNQVVFGNNLFVVSGHNGTIVTSPDGINWTLQTTTISAALFNIEFGNGVFIASGSYQFTPTPHQVFRSTDGINWNGVDTTRLIDFTDGGTYGNGRFILVNRNFIMSSTDGLSWEFVSSPPGFVPKWAEFVNGQYFGVDDSIYGTVGSSTDGVAWTAHDLSATGFTTGLVDATAGAGRFVVSGRNNSTFEGYILSTTDGSDWAVGYSTGTDPATRGGIWGVDVGNNHFIATGEYRILFSNDGVTWEPKLFDATKTFYGAAHGAGTYVVVGNLNTVYTSNDGFTWTPQALPVSASWSDIAFHAGRFVIVASNSTKLLSSPNGIDWTETGNAASFPSRIKVLNGEFVVTGRTSTDGLTWDTRFFSGEVAFSGTEYFNYTTAKSIRSAAVNPQPTLVIDSIARQGNDIVIQWTSGGVLQSRPGIGVGDWGDVNGASNPHQFTNPGGPGAIFRLRSE